jgi:hypothetical protein
VETDACNFQHPPEAEARFFIASDRWHNSSDLCERYREVLFKHVLDTIMLRCSASAVAAVR